MSFRTRRPWNGDEVARLRELAPGKTLAELARLLGRPMQSVQDKAQELGLQPLSSSQTLRAWTPEQDTELRGLYGKGLTFSEIGSALGRTPGACQQRAFKLRLKRDRAVRPAAKASKGKPSKKPASLPASSPKPEPNPAHAAEQQTVDGLDLSSMSRLELLRHLAGVGC